METTYDNVLSNALSAIMNRTMSHEQWQSIYSAYRCALRTYNSTNGVERILAEGLLSHELGYYLQTMRHVQRRTGRMRRIAQLRRKIKVRLHHAATH